MNRPCTNAMATSALFLLQACSIGLALTSVGQASELLALEKGCYSCHGSAQKTGLPTFEHLAAKYAKYQGQTDAASKLASKLREGHLIGGINAHEQLSQESALILIHWIIDGAK